MSVKRNPKISALVVNAIRRLQDVQGSTSKEISNYIAKEYDVSGQDIRRQVQLALRRALSYGVLQRTKGGYYVCSNEGTKEPTGKELICAPKLLCGPTKKKSRRMSRSRAGRGGKGKCTCKKSRSRSRGGRKKRGKKRGGKRKCGHRKKSRSRKSRSRKRSKKSKRSCGRKGKKSRSRSRRSKSRSKSRSKRSCRPKKPRRCNDLNSAPKTEANNNNNPSNSRSRNASLTGSRPNSPGGSTISASSDERNEEIRQDYQTVRASQEDLD